jgi:ureidoacrylate peracid hydrolase
MKMPLAEKLAPGHTALLVVDLQRDFAAPDGLLARRGRDLAMVTPLLTALGPTLQMAKAAKVPVLYTKMLHDRTCLTLLQLEQYDLDGRVVTCDSAGNGHEFYGVQPPVGDVFVKYQYNIFSNSDFVQRLHELGTKTLVIAGMDTMYCVEAAIREAFDRGYKVVVPRDLVACNAKNLDLHHHTLRMVDKVFGVVVDSAEINRVWEDYVGMADERS